MNHPLCGSRPYQNLLVEQLVTTMEEAVNSMERAAKLDTSPWSEPAIQLLNELQYFEEEPFGTCKATEDAWRYEGEVFTEARQAACKEGYEWACEALKEGGSSVTVETGGKTD